MRGSWRDENNFYSYSIILWISVAWILAKDHEANAAAEEKQFCDWLAMCAVGIGMGSYK